jgi:uncharacterized membrane protein
METHMLAGTLLIYGGIAFLGLGLIAAAMEVFRAQPPSRGGVEGPISDATALLKTIGNLKTWVVLALIGFLMICLGGFLTRDLPLESVLDVSVPSSQPVGKQ